LTLAGRDDEPNKGHDFSDILLDQIKRLRDQLDEDQPQVEHANAKGERKTPALHSTSGGRARAESVSRASRSRAASSGTSLTRLHAEDRAQIPARMMEAMDRLGPEQGHMTQGADGSACFTVIMRMGPDGRPEHVEPDEVPPAILAQMSGNTEV
jgi:hypothetical protein